MAKAIRDALQRQITDSERLKYTSATGIINEYNHQTKIATIQFSNPNGDGVWLRKNVPMLMEINGEIPYGTECLLTFTDGTPYTPVIVGICDKFYHRNQHKQKVSSDSGAYRLSSKALQTDINIETIPFIDSWINEDAETDLYENEYFSGISIDKEVNDILYSTCRYSSNEYGITNPETNATIKTTAAGDIDLYVGGSIGLHIDKQSKNISITGCLIANASEWTLNVSNLKINGNLEVNGKLTTKDGEV